MNAIRLVSKELLRWVAAIRYRYLLTKQAENLLVWLAKRSVIRVKTALSRIFVWVAGRLLEKEPRIALVLLYGAMRVSPNQTAVAHLIERACRRLRKPAEVLDFLWLAWRTKNRQEACWLLAEIIVSTKGFSHPSCRALPSFRQRRIGEIGESEGCYRKIADTRVVAAEKVLCFGEDHLVWKEDRPLPENFVAEVRDAVVMGQSFAVFSGQTLWNFSEETRLPYLSAYYSAFFRALPEGDGYLCPAITKTPAAAYESGVLITSRVGFSYFHWIYGCLPKLIFIDRFPEYAGLPMIVGAGMVPQNYQLLDIINVGQRPVIRMQASDVLSFRRLIVPSERCYAPDDLRLHVDRGVIDPDAIRELRKVLGAGQETGEPKNNILWVSRKHYVAMFNYRVRDISNVERVEEYLQRLGAHVICPEIHSVHEQRVAFYHARIVVLVAGSAAANLMFCRPGTTVIVLSQNRHVNPGLLTSIADTLGLKAILVLGPGIPNAGRLPTHWDFEIKLSDLEKAMRWAEGSERSGRKQNSKHTGQLMGTARSGDETRHWFAIGG